MSNSTTSLNQAMTGLVWTNADRGWWNISTPTQSIIMPTEPSTRTPALNKTHQIVQVLSGADNRPHFYPESTTASLGTILHFEYFGNYTLFRSSSQNSCYNSSWPDPGFNHSQTRYNSDGFVIDYRVTSTEPQWFFCARSNTLPNCANGTILSLNPGGITDHDRDRFQSSPSSYRQDRTSSAAGQCAVPYRTVTSGLDAGAHAASSRSAHIPMNTSSVIESVNAGFVSSTPCLFIVLSVFIAACATSVSF